MIKYIYRYKYLGDGKGLRSLISNRDIMFTNPKSFNDPFDCFPVLKLKPFKDLKSNNPYMYSALGLDRLKGAERILAVEKMYNRMRSRIKSGDFISDLFSQASVLSLSKIPDSVLMWSHYAQHHRGAVVEFKIPINRARFFNHEYSHADLISLDVKYEKNRPIMVFDGSPASRETILDQMFLVKSEVWAYEQESRVIKNEGGQGVFSFESDLLNSIILGARNESQVEIKALVSQAGRELGRTIPVFQSEICSRSYKVNLPKFKFKVDER